jgi:CRISPR-associated protein Csm4
MSQLFAFHLWPNSPWHLGEAGVEMVEATDRLHSDTLYSALCHAWALLGFLENDGQCHAPDVAFAIDKPDFTISSAFPVVQNRKQPDSGCLYFWPRPLMDIEPFFALAQEDKQQSKILKSCRYVSNTLWQALVRGQLPEETVEHRSNATFWMTTDEAKIFDASLPDESFFYSGLETLTPRVALDRITSASNLYHVGRLIFAANAGFYFLLEGDEAHAKAITLALEVLQDEGIGGERTYGYGRFRWKQVDSPPTISSPAQANHYCLLSLCSPQTDEVHGLLRGKATYQILKRTGFMQSPVRKDIHRKTLHLLTEGSLFEQEPRGQVVDVKPEIEKGPAIPHRVVRYGKAFAVKGVFFVPSADPSG